MTKKSEQAKLREAHTVTLEMLYAPLMNAMGEQHRKTMFHFLETQPTVLLAWGVKSGYLLWARHNPTGIPTKEQLRAWFVQSLPTQ